MEEMKGKDNKMRNRTEPIKHEEHLVKVGKQNGLRVVVDQHSDLVTDHNLAC
jgi:hypothetical protein